MKIITIIIINRSTHHAGVFVAIRGLLRAAGRVLFATGAVVMETVMGMRSVVVASVRVLGVQVCVLTAVGPQRRRPVAVP
jgi:hypothetical protein